MENDPQPTDPDRTSVADEAPNGAGDEAAHGVSHDIPSVRRRPLWSGAAAGVVSAAVGLGLAELVAGLRKDWRSPVFDVGDRVIDAVPRPLKDLAIRWFGTNDKIALLTGIGSLLGIYALLVGVLAVRRRTRWGVIGIALFGVVGAVCATSARTDPPLHVAVPSVVGALSAALTLAVLTGRPTARRDTTAHDTAAHDTTADDTTAHDTVAVTLSPVGTTALDRRRFLVLGALFTGGAAVVASAGRTLKARSSAAAARAGLVLPRARRPLTAAPASVSAEGASPFFTPNDDFYRIDINLSVPDIDPDSWSLRIHGLVERELTLTYADLLDRELVESDVTLTCVSNEVGGSLMGTARWLGVRLDDLLDEVGVSPDADQIVGRSIDGWTSGFPVTVLDGRDALVVVAMNGEPLPLAHGFPARLIVPGLYGYVSATKWLTEIELTRFDDFDQYWVSRGWKKDGPIKTSSRIDTPRGLSKVAPGVVAVAGVAWAQTRGIDRVELRIDDGEWLETRLADELNDTTWRQWSYAWEATPGRHTLTVRAVDSTGAMQIEERHEPFPDGATGWHSIVVLVDDV